MTCMIPWFPRQPLDQGASAARLMTRVGAERIRGSNAIPARNKAAPAIDYTACSPASLFRRGSGKAARKVRTATRAFRV